MSETSEMDTLLQEAAAVDAQGVTAAPGAEGAPVEAAAPVAVSVEAEARALVEALAWGVAAMFPVLQYDETTKAEGARVLAPLLTKYNVNGSLFEKWGAEINAGMFFGALAFAGFQKVKADIKARENEETSKQNEVAPAGATAA